MIKKQQKILVISRSVPPIKSGSAFIIKEFYNFFNRNEMIFLGEKPEFQYHDKYSINYINTVPIKFKRGNRFLRWYRWIMIPFLVKKIISLAIHEKCTSILCVFPDEIYLTSASLAAIKLKIEFYPYFHNTYYENKKGSSKILAKIIQGKIFKQSAWVYLMSKGMKDHLEPLYPNIKFKILPHSISVLREKKYTGLAKQSKITVITFLGNINQSNIDALTFSVNAIKKQHNFILKIISSTPKSVFKKLDLITDNVIFKGEVNDKNLILELQNSHILLLPHGFSGSLSNTEYKTIFPTRTVQYLFSGIPILAVLPTNCFLYEFIHKNKCAFYITEKSEKKFISMVYFIKNQNKSITTTLDNAYKVSNNFLPDNILTNLKKELFYKD